MPIFFIIVVSLLILLNVRLGYLNRNQNKKMDLEAYLREDFEAGLTRASKIDEGMFIRLYESDLPFRNYDEENDGELIKIQKKVKLSLEVPIIKTDLPTNTEVKKRFGLANLQKVIDGEENFTRLIRHLNKWAKLLIDSGNTADAEQVLEKAVSARSDISETYILLYELYHKAGKSSKMEELIDKTENLPEIAKSRVNSFISGHIQH